MAEDQAARNTVLAGVHERLGAQMVPFAGWRMPVRYADIGAEHAAVRERAGLFDLCHMGRVRFRGPDAATLADRVQTTDAGGLKVGRTRYGMICDEDGGVIDDVLVSREEEAFLLVVNAGNRDADLEVFRRHAAGLDVAIDDDSETEAMVAIQGPRASAVLERLGLGKACSLAYYGFARLEESGAEYLLSRTGYTGEDGFEVFLPTDSAEAFFLRCIEVGGDLDLVPCGLGSRDTLRLEAGMPLYGHELDRETNPFEAGLDFAVRFNHDFIGRVALERIRDEGPARRLIGLVVEGPRVPRHGQAVLRGGEEVGEVRSGTRSFSRGENIATAMVTRAAAEADDFEVDIRGRTAAAHRTDIPFYRRKDS